MPHVPQPRYHPMLRIFSLLPLLEKFNIVVLLLSRCRRHGITESVGRSSCVTAHKMRCKVTKKNPFIQIIFSNNLNCPHFCIIIPHNSGGKRKNRFYSSSLQHLSSILSPLTTHLSPLAGCWFAHSLVFSLFTSLCSHPSSPHPSIRLTPQPTLFYPNALAFVSASALAYQPPSPLFFASPLSSLSGCLR